MTSTAVSQTTGTLYKVTRVGQDVLGGQTNDHAQCIMAMSPNGQYVAGVRFGATTRGFYMTTSSPIVTDVPKVTGSNPYALANDINDSGNSVGHEKWTSGSNVNVIAWYHNRTAGTTVRLLTPYDANASITATPTSMTSDSAYAFGSVDADGPAGPTLAAGGYWNLSTRAWTAISGVREVLDASADGTKLLVIGTDGSGKILSGSVAGGWPTTVYSFTTPRSAGKVSPNGRYVGASQRISGVPTPFIYDTVAGTRTNLPLVTPQDNLGGIIGAVSDTGRALGTIYTTGAAGSFAVLWTSPSAAYTRISNLLVSDGHTALQPSLTSWNVYNGGDGMSADGLTWGVYGSGPLGFEDSLLWQQQCPVITLSPTSVPSAQIGVNYNTLPGTLISASGGTPNYTYTLAASPTPPTWLTISSTGQLGGTPLTSSSGQSFAVIVTDANGCTGTRTYTLDTNALGIGNLVFVDMNNDGIRQSTESGIPGITVQLWSTGADGVRGGSDDAKVGSDIQTDWNGAYAFTNIPPSTYYIRIPAPPAFYPQVSANGDTADNGQNNDSNAIQPGGSGTEVFSPVITLTGGAEPASGIDGDDANTDSTVDFGFANLDPCYAANLFANPSFEFDGTANATGTPMAVLGYNGASTDFGAGVNAFQWVGNVNGSSGLGEPIQNVQVLPGNNTGTVSWIEAGKARHGRRMLLFQNTSSCVSLRPVSGGWSLQLTAGKTYELSVWAANASAANASVIWDLGAASGQIFQIIGGATPGFYQYYTVPQSELTGTPTPNFTSGDYTSTNWSLATANTAQPTWRQYRYTFRINPAATTAQIDSANFVLSGGTATNPLAADYVALCEITPPNALTLGGSIWDDTNNNGIKDAGESHFSAGSISGISLYKSTNTTVGDGDDILITTTATTASAVNNYSFASLAPGNYYVQFTPGTIYKTGGTPDTADNRENNDNNGSQPGGPGTQIRSPMIALAYGTESTADGDTNPDTEFTIDFGLWSGLCLGDQIFVDSNGNGLFEGGTDTVTGLTTLTVELLDNANTVITSTNPNAAGQYLFRIYTAGSYKVRIPTPPTNAPLVALNGVTLDNGQNNDNNGVQTGTQGTAIVSATVSLVAGAEPAPSGVTNDEKTLDIGLRACPAALFAPSGTTLPNAIVGTNYNTISGTAVTATGGIGAYTYTLGGSPPSWMTINGTNGQLSGVPTVPATGLSVTVVATDTKGCSSSKVYNFDVLCPSITITDGAPLIAQQPLSFTQSTGFSATVSNGIGKTWSLVSPPAGFSIGSSDGKISVAAGTTVNVYSVTVRASLVSPYSACYTDKTVSFRVCPTITLADLAMPTTGIAYSDTLSASGGTGPYTYTDGGTLPTGWISRTGAALSGMPTTASVTFTITATDANGCQGSRVYTLSPGCPTITVNPATMPTLYVGVPFSQTFTSSGGTGASTFSVSAGTIPAWATWNAATATLSGTPPDATALDFTIQATDTASCTGSLRYQPVPVSTERGDDVVTVGAAAAVNKASNILYMGSAMPDAENAPTSGNSDADDLLNADDETTLMPATVRLGVTNTITVPVVVPVNMALLSGSTGRIRGFIDWDEDPASAPSATLAQQILDTSRDYVFSFVPPAGTQPGTKRLRLRIQEGSTNVLYNTVSSTLLGEIEDYLITVVPALDYGDHPTANMPSVGNVASADIFMGTNLTDAEASSPATGDADGDDTNGTDDEDVPLPAVPATGSTTLSIPLTLNLAALGATEANLRAFVDWDGSNTITAAETYTLQDITTGGPQLLSITPPAGVTLGPKRIRLRVTEGTTLPTYNTSVTDVRGEIEDHFINVVCPTIAVSTAATSPRNLTRSTAMSDITFIATGGVGSYTYTLNGTLPDGLTHSGGVISGTPTVANQSRTITLTATDANGCSGTSASFVINVDCPTMTITPASAGPFTQYQSISPGTQFTVTNAKAPLNWLATNLPTGLTLSTSGLLDGTPTAAPATYNTVTIQVTDADNCVASIPLPLTITCPAVNVNTPTSLAAGTVGTSYGPVTFAATTTGVGSQTYNWTVSPALPAGMSFSTTGVLDGIPTVAATAASYRFTATNAQGCSGFRDLSFSTVCPTITVTAGSAFQPVAGTASTQTTGASASGISGTFTWSLTGTVPTGLSINSSGQLVTTTATPAGLYNSFNIVATSVSYPSCSGTLAGSLRVCPVFTWTPATLANAVVGTNYSTLSPTIMAATGSGAISSYSLSGAPAWLSINSTSGQLSGTPPSNSPSSVTFTINATDANGCTGSTSRTIGISCPTITIANAPASPATATVGVAYTQSSAAFSASGISGTFNWSASGVPPGMNFNTTTLKLDGTPTTAGTYNVVLTATSASYPTCSGTTASMPITVNCPTLTPNIAVGALPAATQFTPYTTRTFSVSGTSSSVTYTIGGTAPAGMSWSVISNVPTLSGTPTATGSYNLSFTAAHNVNCSTTFNYALAVAACPNLTIAPASLLPATAYLGSVYTQSPAFSATGGSGTYAWQMIPQPLSGTVAQWAGEGNAFDSAGSPAQHGYAANGTVTYDSVTAKVGKSMAFDADSYITVPDNAALTPATFSLEAWVYLPATPPTTRRNLLVKGAGYLTQAPTTGYGLTQNANASTVRFWINGFTTVFAQGTGTAGAWNHIVGTYDGTNARIYVNNAAAVTSASTGVIAHSSEPLRIGNVGTAGGVWDGRLDEVTFYNTALSAANVSARYNATNNVNSILPSGMSFNSSTLKVEGTPVAPSVAGSFPFRIRATDTSTTAPCFGTKDYTLALDCPTINIAVTGTAPANGTVGTAYPSATFTASGGTGNYTWTVSSGSLPTGLSLTTSGVNNQIATLTGTPTTPATYSFTLRATDANACFGSVSYSNLVMSCPTITITDGAAMQSTTGTAFTQATGFSATVSNGLGTTWSLVTPPAGFSIGSADGKVGVTSAVAAGVYSLTVRATLAAPYTACYQDKTVSFRVCPVITITPSVASPLAVTIGTAYNPAVTFTASGGTANYTWNMTGTLPVGLTWNPAVTGTTATITGTPTGNTSGTVTITATDANGCPGTPLSYTINPTCPTITITDGAAMQSITGTAFTQATGFSATVSNGLGKTWSLVTPPAGFSIGSADGKVSVTSAVASGLYSLTVRATLVAPYTTCTQDKTVSFRVCPIITVTPSVASPLALTTGTAYNPAVTFTASGGTANYTWNMTGTLPAGLIWNPAVTGTTATITGTPTGNTSGTVTITATDANGCPGTPLSYTINPTCPTITITDGAAMQSTTGTAFTQATGFSATVSNGVGKTWSIDSPPAGFSINSADGKVSVTSAVAAGVYSLTVRATLVAPYTVCSQTKMVSFRVCPVLAINNINLSPPVGSPYSDTITVSNSTGGSVNFSTASAQPIGGWLSLASNGALSGTPPNSTPVTFTVTATDGNGCSGQRTYTITPGCPALTVTTAAASPLALTRNTAMSTLTFSASGGGASTYIWSLNGILPSGLSFNYTTPSASVTITGTPDDVESRTFSVTATTAGGCSGTSANFTINVDCPTMSITPSSAGPFTQYADIADVTFSVTNAKAPLSWSATNLPAGLTLSSAGLLDGIPTAAPATYNTVTVQVTDADNCTSSRVVPITITCPAVNVDAVTLADGIVGSIYPNVQFTASTAGTGVQAYTWSVSPALPAGLSFNSSGLLDGTPTSPVTNTTYRFTASNPNACTGFLDVDLRVLCPTITITDGAAMQSITGTAFTQATGFSATVSNGIATTWSLVTPPAGFSINSADGKVSVTSAVAAGIYSLTLRATLVSPYTACSQTKTVSFRVCPVITITPDVPSIATPTIGTNTTITFTASGGTGPYTWTQANTLPSGMVFTPAVTSSTATLSGAPRQTIGRTINLTATDADGCPSAIFSYSVAPVCPTMSITDGVAMQCEAGTTYTQSAGFSASVSNGVGVTWSLVTPPAGFSIDSVNGKLTVASTVTPGAYPLTVRSRLIAPYAACFVDKTVSFRVCPIFTWSPASLPDAVVNSNYASPATLVTATGSGSITSYSLTGAPAWLSIDNNGQLSGTPLASAASATFIINATDANGCTGSVSRSIAVTCPVISISEGTAMQSTTGTSYTQTTGFSASSTLPGGYTWSLVSPPVGLSIGAADGKLGVTSAVTAGVYSVTVRATAASFTSCSSDKTFSFRVCPVLSLNNINLIPVVGVPYSGAITVSNSTGGTVAFSTASAQPVGGWLTLNAEGTLSGTPPNSTPVTFTVTATDGNGCSGQRTYTITPGCPAITISATTSSPMAITRGVAMTTLTFSASGGGSSNYSWTLNGTLPDGLSFNNSTPAASVSITGTPTAIGSSTFNVTATLPNGCFEKSDDFIINVDCPTMEITPTSAGPFVQGQPITGVQFHVTNAVPPISWSASDLPDGLTIDQATGMLSGTPIANVDTYSATVSVKDAEGCKSNQVVEIRIAKGPDIYLEKSVMNIENGSTKSSEAGKRIEYTLNYGNIGDSGAAFVKLTDPIPQGTTFVPGSIRGVEDGGIVNLLSKGANGRVDAIEITWPWMPGPGSYVGERLRCYGMQADTTAKISQTVGNFSATLNNLARFGSDVAVIGDVDQDGIQDLAVGSYLYDSGSGATGAVFILFRNADGTVRSHVLISEKAGGLPGGSIPIGSQFGTSVTGIGDFDKDGVPDIAVGAPQQTTIGVLHVLFLKSDGTVKASQQITENVGGFDGSFTSGMRFGAAVDLLGDINLDGVPDLVVGAPVEGSGSAYILLMKTNHDGTVLKWLQLNEDTGLPDLFGTAVTGIGDVNGDGMLDLAVGAVRDTTRGSSVQIYSLNTDGKPQSSTLFDGTESIFGGVVARASRFGTALAGGVDFNQDGIADLVVGAYGDDGAPVGTRPFAGAAYIVHMGRDMQPMSMIKLSAATQPSLAGLDSSDNFGFGVAVSTDLNGDGYPDIIGGAPQDDDGGSNRGAIWELYLQQNNALPCTINGSHVQAGTLTSPPASAEIMDSPVTKIASSQHPDLGINLNNSEEFGSAVTGIGDINGDGYNDIAIGAWKEMVSGVQYGAVYILLMGENRTITAIQRITLGDGGFGGTLLANDRFGCSLAALGDIRGDGTTALAVGAYNDDDGAANSNRGAVWILFIDSKAKVIDQVKISSTSGGFTTLTDSDNFGYSLAALPDLNNDGVPELLASAYGDDTGGTDRGAAYVLSLKNDGTVNGYNKIAEGLSGFPTGLLDNGDRLGCSVASLGDLNGDGYQDIALGAEQDDDGGTNRGALYVCLLNNKAGVGSLQKISSITGGFSGTLDASDFFGCSMTSMGDLNGDGLADLLVGAKNDDDVPVGGTGSNRGALWLLNLNADGTAASWRKTSAAAASMSSQLAVGDLFGHAVGNVGDIDGDGRPEIAGGAPIHADGGTARGAVWIANTTPYGYYSSGTYEKIVTANALGKWMNFTVDQTVPPGTSIVWSIYNAAGDKMLFGPSPMTSGPIDVSYIDASENVLIVRAELSSTSSSIAPVINGWDITYDSTESRAITFQVTVNEPAPEGLKEVINTAQIESLTPDTDPGNNSSSANIGLLCTDVVVTSSVNTPTAHYGQTVEFTLDWNVNGPEDAVNAVLNGTLPPGFTFVSASLSPDSISGQELTWNLGSPPVLGGSTITILATVSPGTPLGTYSLQAQISNERQEADLTNNLTETQITLECPKITVTTSSLPNGTAGSSYGSYYLNATTDGPGQPTQTYTWSVTPALPAGLTFSAGGEISGTPSVASPPTTYTFSVTNQFGCSNSVQLTLTILCPAITVNPVTMPTIFVNVPFSRTFTATGASGTYTFSVSAGSIPVWATWNAATATLSGTPPDATALDFTITATDASTGGCTGSRRYQPVPVSTDYGDHPAFPGVYNLVSPHIFLGTSITDAESSAPSTGNGDADDSTAGGRLDDEDLALASIPATGTTNLSIPVTLNLAALGASEANLRVFIDWSGNNLMEAGETFTLSDILTGGTLLVPVTPSTNVTLGPKKVRLRIGASTSLPTFSSNPATPVYGEVEDHFINVVCPTVNVATTASNPLNLNRNTPMTNVTFTATGGVGTYTYALNGTLPDGLTHTGGVISGTPTIAGQSRTVTITATDSNGCTGTSANFVINVDCATMTISPSSAGPFTQYATISDVQFLVSNAKAPLSWSASNLPAGLSLSSTGLLYGTPTANPGTYNTVTVQVTDADNCNASRVIPVTISCPSVNVTTNSLPNGIVGTLYPSIQFEATTTGAAPLSQNYTWSVSPALPNGLTLSPSGSLSGTPRVPSSLTSYRFTATNQTGCSGFIDISFAITCPSIVIQDGTAMMSTVGTAYTQSTGFSATVSNGIGVTWSLVTPPTGFSIGSNDGKLSVTNSVAVGLHTLTVRATLATPYQACSTDKTVSYRVCPVLTWTPATLPNASADINYNTLPGTQVTASGGSGGYTYSLSSAPAWMSIDSSTGQLSGIPSAPANDVTFTVLATDSAGCPGSKVYTIDVGGLRLGNFVFHDQNSDGTWQTGEPGVAGAIVQLFTPGADNAPGGSGSNADTQIGANITTDSTGLYSFSGLEPGSYFVKVTPPASYSASSGTPSTTDDDIDNNNDGSQPGGAATPLFSPVIALVIDAEPINDGDTDPNSNNTIDFALAATVCVGNLVFNDVDHNGYYNTGDQPLDGVSVRLFAAGSDPLVDLPVASTLTSGGGHYSLCVAPGTYFLHIPPSDFSTVLTGLAPTLAPVPGPVSDLDDDADQNLLPTSKAIVFGVRTGDFTLATNAAPTAASGETGHLATSDDASDSSVNLTLDLGLYTVPVAAAPLSGTVRRELSSLDTSTTPTEPLSGIQVILYTDTNSSGTLDSGEMAATGTTTTDSGGQYQFDLVPPGDYLVIQSLQPGAEATYDTDGGDLFCTSVSMGGQAVTGIDFRQSITPDTFVEWQAAYPNGADNDGDAYSSLIEYALGTTPGRADAPCFWLQPDQATQTFSAVLHRDISGHRDISYRLEGSADLQTWTHLQINATVTPHADGTETLRYPALTQPFIRLAIVLDADLNGQPEQTATTPVLGWHQHTFAASAQTFSMPLLRPAVYTGSTSSATGSALKSGHTYYAEVTSGIDAGKRYEIDEAASSAEMLIFEGGVAPAAATQISIRPHWTLRELLPVAAFQASNAQENADRILCYDGSAFRIIWLYAAPEGPRWVRRGDATLADVGTTPLRPDEGILVHPRTQSVTLPLMGEVRGYKMALQPRSGSQLIASGTPLAQSPATLGLDTAAGYHASTTESTADRFHLWLGDETPGASGYQRHYYQSTETAPRWIDSTTGVDVTQSQLSQPFRAFFLVKP